MEVEALFEQELGKMYNEGNPEDDMVEKVSKLFIVVLSIYILETVRHTNRVCKKICTGTLAYKT